MTRQGEESARTKPCEARAADDAHAGRKAPVPSRARHAASIACEVTAIVAVPAVLVSCAVLRFEQTALLSLVVAVGALFAFFAGFEGARPRMRDIMPTVVLAALAAAGRILFAAIPDFKPVSAIAIIAGATFGRRSGFMVGALAALASNFFFGQGPWTPWQMYAWGLVGYLAGLIAQTGAFRTAAALPDEPAPRTRLRAVVRAVPLVAYGFVSGLLYGAILNTWSFLGFLHPLDTVQIVAIYAAALPFDAMHGMATVVFLLALYAPWRRKLDRIKRAYGLGKR